jgi:hypothetical protein
MAGERTARSCLLTTIDIPTSAGVPLRNAQDHDRIRQYCTTQLDKTLPDMISVEVRPGAQEGAWRIQVWECPDE